MSEYNGYTAPMADYNVIKEQAEEVTEARRPITLEEMMDLRTFFGNRDIAVGDAMAAVKKRKEAE